MSEIRPTQSDIRKAAKLIDSPVLNAPGQIQYIIFAGWLYKASPDAPLMRTKKLNRPGPDDWEIAPFEGDPLAQVLRDASPTPEGDPHPTENRRQTW